MFTSIFVLGVSRFSIIGQGIDDAFRLVFGWTKYLIYLLAILTMVQVLLGKTIWWKKPTKGRTYWQIIWIVFNLYWTLGIVGIIIWNVQQDTFLKYETYHVDKLVPDFVDNWYQESIYQYKIINAKDFFKYHQVFSRVLDSGGVLGVSIASIFAYLSIFGAIIVNLFSWFLVITYLIHNQPWFYFLTYERRNRIRWKNLNEDKKYRIQTNIIDEIEDQDMTIELQTAKKIQIQDENKANTIDQLNKDHQQLVKQKSEETIQTVKIDLDQEQPEPTQEEWKTPHEDEKFLNWMQTSENNLPKETEPPKSVDTFQEEEQLPMPSVSLFSDWDGTREKEKAMINQAQAKSNADKIRQVFNQYRVEAKINNWQVGPRVTRYEVHLPMGTKVQKILELEKEFKLILGEERIRFEAPIVGQSQAVGIEVPNQYATLVNWKEVAAKINQNSNQLLLGIGKDLTGQIEKIELNSLPHLLVAGSTGGGKTMCLLTIISSLIYQHSPQNLKLLLIDPKMVELAIFNGVPHLITPVVTETRVVPAYLDKIITEINNRFNTFRQQEVVNIDEFNQKVDQKAKMPWITVVIDELADLILIQQKTLENKIVRIGQIGRAAGVFMVIATQRPSVDVITGLIKTNIPGRIAFSVPNHTDSRTILNFSGAERLMGKGDMLYIKTGAKPKRIQGTSIQREDINNLVQFWKNQDYQNYFWKEFADVVETVDETSNLYEEVKKYVTSLDQVSISLLQRRFNLGFNRAANIFDKLEAEKIIGPSDGDKKPRKVIKNQS